MIHVVDYRTQKILTTLSNKPGAIVYWEDWHEKSLQDHYETFDFIMSLSHENAEHVAERNVVIIKDEDDTFREFIIRETNRSGGSMEVLSDASFVELRKQKIIDPTTRSQEKVSTLSEWILQGTDWRVGKTIDKGLKSFSWDFPIDALEALYELADAFDVELRFRIEIAGNNIVGRFVDFLDKAGHPTGKEVTIGKDLIGLRRRETSDNVVTALVGVGPLRENGTRIIVRVEDDEALERWGRNNRHLWGVYEPPVSDERVSSETIREMTRQELERRIKTLIQYEADAANIEHIFGRSHEKVILGDSIRLKDTYYKPPIYLDARVIKVRRSPSDPSRKIYTLGDFIEYAEEDVVSREIRLLMEILKQKEAILKSPTPPVNPSNDQLWIDTSDPDRDVWKRWDASLQKWIEGPSGPQGETGPPGPPGPPGYTPIKGVDYFDGKPGASGKSAYLWIKYSPNYNGDPMSDDPTGAKYIGIATTETEEPPDHHSAYTWSRIEGPEGLPGEPGPSGKTSYLHIKYSNDGGETLTGNNGEETGDWIGTYVDFHETDSLDPSRYTWNKIKGDQGIPGEPGADGRTPYLHIAYANNATGTEGFSTSDAVKKDYVGYYTDFTAADSTDPSRYTWQKVKGERGAPGFVIDWVTENVEIDEEGRLRKTGGSPDAWDAQAYSREAYVDGAYLTFKVMSTWSDLAVGLSDNKTALPDNSMSYALKFKSRQGEAESTPSDEKLIRYTVESGDSYWKIGEKLGTTTARLLELNPGIDPAALYVGQKIIAPMPLTEYTAKANDTFAIIASRFHTTTDTIQELNPSVSPLNVYPGLVLTVPKPVGNFTVPNGLDDPVFRDEVLALTSHYETQKPFPYNYGTAASDFDGAGISWGAIQFNAKTGPLISIWQTLIRDHWEKVEAAFDHPERTPEQDAANLQLWKDLINRGNFNEIRQWSYDRGDPNTGRHSFKEPWNTYFMNLGLIPEAQELQKQAAAWYYQIATQWFNQLGLWSRRGYSLMFDIAVQSGSMNPKIGTDENGNNIYYDLIGEINEWAASQDWTGKTAQEIETAKLVRIANRRADYIPTEWGPTWRQRKIAIAEGSGYVYNGSLWMNTDEWNMKLEPVSIENVPRDLLFDMEEIEPQPTYTEVTPTVSALEDGVETVIGEYADGDRFTIHYDSVSVKYYQNGTLIRQIPAKPNLILSADSSFKTIGTAAQVYNIYFAPSGAKGEHGDPGPQGVPGKSSYTHIAYANNETGTKDFSVSDSTGRAYIGIYVDNEPDDSTDPSRYKWTLIKGAPGDQGLPGPPGEDGKTPYFHVAYANNETGTVGFSTSDPTNKTYIGTYTDFTPQDSTDPTKYTWTKFVGPRGEPGHKINWALTNVELSESQAIQKTGGSSSEYNGTAISAEAYVGGAMFSFKAISAWSNIVIGLSINKTPGDHTAINYGFLLENTPTMINGREESPLSVIVNGNPTQVGTYGGEDRFVINYDNEKAKYYKNGELIYETFTISDRTLSAKILIKTIGTAIQLSELYFIPTGAKGAPGQKGDPGAPGKDGKSFYTWIKYADSPTAGMSDSPTGKRYIGIAYNKESPAPSANYADYSWSLIKGEQGVPGPPGESGETLYTWIKYADDENGSGMSDSPNGKKYLGLAYNKPTATESTNPADYTWSLITPEAKINDNLVLNSNKLVESTAYHVGKWYLSEPWKVGEKYTVTIKATLTPGTQSLLIYRDTGWTQFGVTGAEYIPDEGVYRLTATAAATSDPQGADTLTLWSAPSGTAGKYTRVDWIKVEKGTEATPWSPNPKDAARLVDSNTEIEAHIITANHLNVSNLSAISANLGEVTAGKLTSNTEINVTTDLNVGENIILREKESGIYSVIFQNKYGMSDARIYIMDGNFYVSSMTVPSHIVLDADFISLGNNGNILLDNYSSETHFVQKVKEKGYCGIGGREPQATSGVVCGTGVNFRNRKTYTPSSIKFTALSYSHLNKPLTANITPDGFWMYLTGQGTSNSFVYWRGYYEG